MFPKKGKKLPEGPKGPARDKEFRQAVAAALKSELGTTHQAIKTVMRWTGASERAVKHWFAGSHGPSGCHLVAITRHSDAVLETFLEAAGRHNLLMGIRWISIKPVLAELLRAIDENDPS